MLSTPDSACPPRRTATTDMLGIASLWCLSFLVVNPLGDFPLNDDWSFGLTVKHLVENGDFRPSGWFPMPFITNALWGSLFCIPFGFSFTALRISTITLSLIGILGVYILVRGLRQPRWLAVIIALTLGFNPVYYALSNTFMTDVPCAAIMILAAIFFARALRSDSNLHLLIATTLAVAATLSRQLAISIPLAFGLSLLLTRRFTIQNMLRAAISPTVVVGALLVFRKWLEVGERLHPIYQARMRGVVGLLSKPGALVSPLVATNAHLVLLYLGLFLLPVLIFVAAAAVRSDKKQMIVLLSFAAGLLAWRSAILVSRGRSLLMPLSHNILIGSGIGPLTLRDTHILSLDHVPWLPWSFWLVVTAMSLLGATLLIAVLSWAALKFVSGLRLGSHIPHNQVVGIFFLLSGVIYLLPLLVAGFYDRYLIPVIPLFAACAACAYGCVPQSHREKVGSLRSLGVVILVAMSVFAIGATRDYLAWNRLRWDALRHLMEERGVAASNIDGGFEFGGLYLSGSKNYQKTLHAGTQDPTNSWWWVQEATYLIAFGDVTAYKVIKEYTYLNWITPRIGKILVLQKNSLPLKKKQ